MFRNIAPIIIVVIFAVIAGFSLLKPGLPPTHDGEYHIIRFYEFDKVLREGNFYPRWAPDLNNGYGIPLFNYVYPLPNYVASFFHLLGFSFIDAFKIQMFTASILGAIFFYLFTKQFWGTWGGIMASIFYTYSPYRFVDIYVRGSVGEVWALALFPAVLWSITKILKEKRQLYLPLVSLFLSLLIFSHNILGLMFFIFFIFYGIFLIFQSQKRKELLIKFLVIIMLGLGLSSIFWMPAILEQGYVRGLQIYNVKDNFPELYQLIFPSWGTGFSSSDLQNQMSFQIGIVNLLVVLINITLLFLHIKKQSKNAPIIIFFLAWFILIFFLMLKISFSIWETVPFLNYFQFPWRLLSLEILISSFLAGSIFVKPSKLLAILMISSAFILTYNYTKPAYYHQRDDNYYISRSNFIDGTNSVGNYFNTSWFNNKLKKQKNRLELGQNDKILSEKIKSQKYNFSLLIKRSKTIIVNTAYFPGWTVFLNKSEIETKPSFDGRISFYIPSGKHLIEVKFIDTPLRSIAKNISVSSLVIIILLFLKNYYVRIRR